VKLNTFSLVILLALIPLATYAVATEESTDNAAVESSEPSTEQVSVPKIHPTPTVSSRITIDKIVARVNGSNILLSEINHPQLRKEGGRFTLDEAIIEELLCQRATEMHMVPAAADIDRQLLAFKMQNNLTGLSDKEFEDHLKQFGFTLKEYKNQLSRMLASENARQAEISERIIVTSQEVEEYYKKHPDYTKEEYQLQVCALTADEAKKIDEAKLDWESLGWIERDDIGKKFSMVFSMKKGQQSDPIALDDGSYQLVKLLDKKERRLKTLDEQYHDIERTLQQGRKDTYLVQFEKELKEKASIVYLE
jgi:parvulin-like peptidyl-prolyl isomerase